MEEERNVASFVYLPCVHPRQTWFCRRGEERSWRNVLVLLVPRVVNECHRNSCTKVFLYIYFACRSTAGSACELVRAKFLDGERQGGDVRAALSIKGFWLQLPAELMRVTIEI